MSAVTVRTDLEDLKRQITRLERGGVVGAPAVVAARGVALGHPSIDAKFQGGVLPFGVHEAAAMSGTEAAPAMGFALMLMARTLSLRPGGLGLIIQVRAAAGEHGALYGPGLAALGLDPARLALVRTRNADEALKVVDEALRCGAAAAITAEVWDEEKLDLSMTRRFNLSAQAHDVMAFLVTREQVGTSSALTRWSVGAGLSQGQMERARRRGLRRALIGRPALHLALTRNRRGADGGWPLGEWDVEWDGEQRIFSQPERFEGQFQQPRLPPLSASVAGPAGHRPYASLSAGAVGALRAGGASG
jgi:protein ImuA